MSKEKEKSAFEKLKEHWLFQASEEDIKRIIERLTKLVDLIRGKVDIKSRLMLLANPENIKTSSILSPNQCDFVAGAYFDAKHFDIFEPLRDFAEELAQTLISKHGLGREQQIRFVQALQEAKSLKQAVLVGEKSKEVQE